MRKRSIVILAIVWMVILVGGISSAVTMAVMGSFAGVGSTGNQEIVVTRDQYQRLERYERLDEVFWQLKDNYYQDLSEDRLVLGAVRGMLASVDDPYTYYYTPEEMKKSTEQNKGIYEGVGLMLTTGKEGNAVVMRVYHNTPAHEAGVMPGDILLKVGDQPITGQNGRAVEEANELIQTQEGSLVTLTLRRDSEILTIGMTRRAIQLDSVEYHLMEKNVGYIGIYNFTGDDVSAFKDAVRDLKALGVTKLIIDVRYNSGGLLSDVVDIVDQLIPSGLIVYTQDRDGRRIDYFADDSYWDVDMAVLVNGLSASASEILAGALQDTGRAVIVGETSFGKGIVQTQLSFPSDGAGMQLTTATYYTPSGKSIHGVGIVPDIVVVPDERGQVYAEPNVARDSQLRAAYEALTK